MKPAHLIPHLCAILGFAASAAGQTITTPNDETGSRGTFPGEVSAPGQLAAVLVVTSTADSGPGSFRQAVLDAPAGSTINFNLSLPATISLTSGQIVIDKNLIIKGPGSTLLTVQNTAGAGPANRIFRVSTGTSTISGLTAKDGNLVSGNGGGISNSGNLTLNDVTVTNCRAPGAAGGGVETTSSALTLNNCTLSNNTGYNGGGMAGPGTINNSTITGNIGTAGGGIYGYGTLKVNNSTISGNTSRTLGPETFAGGGVYSAGTTTLTNTTVSNNVADKAINTSPGAGGGGICVNGGTLTLLNTTIADNTTIRSAFPCQTNCNTTKGSGAGIFGPATVGNSIIASNVGNGGNSDFSGALNSQGYNLIGSNLETTISGDPTGNLVGTNANPVIPQLAALAANNGPTNTRALLPNSPAINSGNPANLPPTDQRGFGRNGTPDKGAFEFNGTVPPVPVVSAVSRKTHPGAGIFDTDLPLTGTAGVECRAAGANGTHTLVITFANNLTNVSGAVVTAGTGSVSSSQIGSDAHQYLINLGNVANAQRLTVTLNNVTDSSGYSSSAVPVTVGLLVGDANADQNVNSGDVIVTRNRSGQPTDATNFRSDYNLDGTINSGDAIVVRSRSGTSLP